MKMQEAMQTIALYRPPGDGFMVHFERVQGCILASDYFPDKSAGEDLIASEEAAWKLAELFAKATYGRCVNVYVVNSRFSPVAGYNLRMIVNRDVPSGEQLK